MTECQCGNGKPHVRVEELETRTKYVILLDGDKMPFRYAVAEQTQTFSVAEKTKADGKWSEPKVMSGGMHYGEAVKLHRDLVEANWRSEHGLSYV